MNEAHTSGTKQVYPELKIEKEMKQTQENISISKGKPFIIEKITSKALPDADICHEEFEQINY